MNPSVESAPTPPFHRSAWFRISCLAVLLGAGLFLFFRNGGVDGQKSEKPEKQLESKRPVILLTGFEPFGKGKPDNPSWEAIKGLDGLAWKDYQLVCKRLPVVWGAPREHLDKWIDAYEPVAVFSFGQGATGAFALETKASNLRAGAKDNEEKLPGSPKIIDDGPAGFDATIAFDKFKTALSDKGYKVRVSTAAGRYLCEETLYTLEYLKSTKNLEATVMFCHVPPLGTKIGEQNVTPEYVQQFVKDVLLVWHVNYQGEDAKGRQRDNAEIKKLITKYFSTWSNADINGYDSCFLRDASIQHIDIDGSLTTSNRPDFITSQRDYHRTAKDKTTEVAETVEIRHEGRLSRVVVYWKLTAGKRIDYGYDHFTLIRTEAGWRIVNLTYYTTPKDAK